MAYRDDRDTLIARVERLERDLAEATAARAPRACPLVFARAAAGEIVVLWRWRSFRFLVAGESSLAFGWVGIMPAGGATVRLDARGVPCRDGALDLDLRAIVSIAPHHDGREMAARYFVDATVAAIGHAAEPMIEGALRAACATRARASALGIIADDTRITAQRVLRDFGLEIGDVLVTAPGGIVRRA